MNFVLDSNILLRMAQTAHPLHAETTQASADLLRRGEIVHIIPQTLYEFWSVATREIQYNGLGLSISDAQIELARLRTIFSFLPDTSAIFPEWERLVTLHGVKGRDSHDTRIVAAMHIHHVTHLLTYNKDDFKRFSSVTVLSPAEI
jgi:predicted nucleic acid-binding protein